MKSLMKRGRDWERNNLWWKKSEGKKEINCQGYQDWLWTYNVNDNEGFICVDFQLIQVN